MKISWKRHPALAGIPAEAEGLLTLPRSTQLLLGIGTVILLIVPFVMTDSLLGFAAILGVLLLWTVVRSPSLSLFGFIAINVAITLRHKGDTIGSAPSPIELLFGLFLVAILGYWIVRIRILELQPLGTSAGQLCLLLFFGWSITVTLGGIVLNDNSISNALRELLNLSPLLILPILYERYIDPDSKIGWGLFAAVFFAGCFMVIWTAIQMRSNVIRAVYLYQTGRGSNDEALSSLLILIATSLLMSVRQPRKAVLAGGLLLFAWGGLILSLRRSLYVGTLISMAILLWFGDSSERKRGSMRAMIMGLIGVSSLIPLYYSSRIFRLMLLNFINRFLSVRHSATDISLLNRFEEWGNEWHAILHSPLFGYGFGAQFRTYDMIRQFHSWMTFSHSSYLYMIFKTGFPGAILFFAAYFAFLYKGFRLLRWPHHSNNTRVILRICVAFLILILMYAYTEPVLDSKTDLVWVGLIWGYLLTIERRIKNYTSSEVSIPPCPAVPQPV